MLATHQLATAGEWQAFEEKLDSFWDEELDDFLEYMYSKVLG